MCMCVSPHECICPVCMLEAKGMHWSPGARVTDDCEPPYGCWASPSVLNPRTISAAPFFVILMIADDPETGSCEMKHFSLFWCSACNTSHSQTISNISEVDTGYGCVYIVQWAKRAAPGIISIFVKNLWPMKLWSLSTITMTAVCKV